jgi:two-component system cell cycle response regulator DivK
MPAKVLYIEDDPVNMNLVRKILRVTSYEFLGAPDGTTGLAMVEREKPDLILMDINLPDTTGWDVTQQIKSTPALAHIPVIALTANYTKSNIVRGLEVGCSAYLTKPISRTELLMTIEQFMPGSGVAPASTSAALETPPAGIEAAPKPPNIPT